MDFETLKEYVDVYRILKYVTLEIENAENYNVKKRKGQIASENNI